MRRISKAVRFQRIADKLMGRKGVRKDGSIGTKPVVPVPDATEGEVMSSCQSWMEAHGLVMDRLNNGAGVLGNSPNYCTYGIIGGGDWVGMLPGGRHLEVECKKGKGGTLSKEQVKRMARVKRGGGVYIVVHGAYELDHKLRDYL